MDPSRHDEYRKGCLPTTDSAVKSEGRRGMGRLEEPLNSDVGRAVQNVLETCGGDIQNVMDTW